MNINISCPINNTGYGLASLNILKEISKNHNVALFPIGQPSVSCQEDYDLILKLFNNKIDCDINAPYIKIWHQFDLFEHIGKGKYFAFPFFELDTFNKLEVNCLNVPDTIIATSCWAADIISKHVNTPTSVVPLGVDLNIFDYTKPLQEHSDKYVFLNIGKWEIRKGHDILLELFQTAFPDNKDVELWILASETTNSYSKKEELDKWKSMYNQPRVKLFNGVDSQQDIANLISKSSCGLYPSRAEGWNLELLESMAMNKPVITTNYSAHTEFCTRDNSFLIDILETEKAYDGKAFYGQGNWAKIGPKEKDQIIDYMRYVVKNNIKINQDGLKTANRFSWSNSADCLLRCISQI
jgi:glycosyltransferase involved in cell wall biosynthesis